MHKTKQCIACHELIHLDASLCRFCGTVQKPNRWHTVSKTLKWLGGIITVISLIVGMITLSRYYLDWQERREALANLVEAAEWLMKTQDYPQAWNIYKEALELDPVSAKVRQGQFQLAKQWLRHFNAKKEQTDRLLNEITNTLYQGIRAGSAEEVATTLAHAGWAQVLRKHNNLAVPLDIDLLFQRALSENPKDVYANAMYGYWILLKRGVTVEKLQQAQLKFATALEVNVDRQFVRRLQFNSLREYISGRSDEMEQAALSILLQASASMLKNAEARPSEYSRYDILRAYGSIGSADNVEGVLEVMPAMQHLAVIAWLMEGLSYTSGSNRDLYQIQYVQARLAETLDKPEHALQQYKQLLTAENTSKKLDQLINQGILRLSGKLPARAQIRNYRNDPIDTSDLWHFHTQTLIHFDPQWQTSNFTQALSFFRLQIEQASSKLPDLISFLPIVMQRTLKVVRQGDEISSRNSYTSGFGAFDHENARLNYWHLSLLYTQVLLTENNYDGAIAVLTDLKLFADNLDERWLRKSHYVLYQLAHVYALRAMESGNTQDIEKSLNYLQAVVQVGAVDGDISSWDEIKGDDFQAIKNELRYLEMIKGR